MGGFRRLRRVNRRVGGRTGCAVRGPVVSGEGDVGRVLPGLRDRDRGCLLRLRHHRGSEQLAGVDDPVARGSPRRHGRLAADDFGLLCLLGLLGLLRGGRGDRLGRHPGDHGLGHADRLALLRRRDGCRSNRFRSRGPVLDRRLRAAPGRRSLRRHLAQVRGVEVLGAGRGLPDLSYRRARGAAVGEGADRARGGVGDRRAEMQRAARGRLGRRRAGEADCAEVDRTAVAARRLVRAGLVHRLHDRLRRGRRHLVAPRALGTRQQQQVFVLGGGLGEVGVRTVRGGARLFHHACALRQSLARDLAGVGHAYPSPIG